MRMNACANEQERQKNNMNHKTPLFSIIIPAYGVEPYLPQAIESVLAQSVSDWEMILVDDGSKDNCGAICDAYAARDSRIRVIHKENGGLVSARQTGIMQSSGVYVLNLDGDDYWDSDMLSNLSLIIDQYMPDGILFGFRKVTQENQSAGELHNRVSEGMYTGERLLQVWNRMLYDPNNPELNGNFGIFCHGIVLAAFRREIVLPLQLAVPKQIRIGEDAAVTFPAICGCDSVYFTDRIMYNYRTFQQSMVRSFSQSEPGEMAMLISHLKEYATHLPAQNLDGYLYRGMEIYWVKAAKNLSSYAEFKACVQDSLRVIPENAFEGIARCKLKMKYRIRVFIVKHRLWYLFWRLYHKV